jgi:CheY-like chemotaxis protein
MFEKFTQADASTTRRYGGTGLGLAISKRLVELMGGEIGLVSEEGHGSEFWFTVHLAKQSQSEPQLVPVAEIRGAHILVVDDNATNREVLAAQLRAWGVRPEEVADGPSALLVLGHARDADDPFAAAIVDMQMPDMDGAGLARAIKADATLAHTRLILMTSLGQRGEARQMEEIGFSAYLMKPARQSDLFDSLSTVLAHSPISQASHRIITRHAVREMRRGAIRILLAEDNVTNQQVALGILKKLGLRADAVGDGAEAITSLETTPYDLVLMDVQMPVMDGLEATRLIRDPRSAVLRRGIPIIAMTAHAMQGDRERCLEAGMDGYIAKPIRPAELFAGIKPFTRRLSPILADPAPPTEVDCIDWQGAWGNLEGDRDLMSELAGLFLDDLPHQMEAIHRAVDQQQNHELERLARRLKTSVGNFAAKPAFEAAVRLENIGCEGDFTKAPGALKALEHEIRRLRDALEAWVTNPSGNDPVTLSLPQPPPLATSNSGPVPDHS